LKGIISAAVLALVSLAAVSASAQPVVTRDGDNVTVRATRITTPMKMRKGDESVYADARHHRVRPAGSRRGRAISSAPSRG
jgi:hypothetical protein